MHYVVYGRESNLVVAALVRGLRAAKYRVTVQRAELFRPDEAVKEPDRVVVSGLRGKYTEVKEYYRAAGVPIIVREAPHLRDTDRLPEVDGLAPRYQRLSLDTHAWLPPFDCDADRFDALNLSIGAVAELGSKLLICGQTDRDTQHGKTVDELAAWLSAALPAVKERTGLMPVWRPHPRAPEAPMPGADLQEQDPAELPISEALLEAGAVLTYNSTVGLTASRLGIPVYCGGPATYRPLAYTVESAEVRPPEATGEDATRGLLARVAYTQWTLPEIEAGAWIHTLERALGDDGRSAESLKELQQHVVSVGAAASARALSLDQAVATLAQQRDAFTLREALRGLNDLGLQAKRPAVRGELDILVQAGAIKVIDKGGRGRPRLWQKEAPQ